MRAAKMNFRIYSKLIDKVAEKGHAFAPAYMLPYLVLSCCVSRLALFL